MTLPETLSDSLIKNFPFRNGALWFPVVNVDTKAVIKPIMQGADLGSMMPAILLSIPDIWESKALPFENIVSFEHSIVGEGAVTATLVFLDQTPIFAEMLVRQYMIRKKTRTNYNGCVIRWGWRVQNPTEELKQYLDSGMLLTSHHTFSLIRASYSYTPFGVMISMSFTADSINKLEGFYMKSGNIKEGNIVDNDTFEAEIARLINDSVQNDKRFIVKLKGPNLANTNFFANMKDVQYDNNTTVREFIEEVRNKMVISPNEKGKPFGRIEVYYPEAPTLLDGIETYVIIYYDKDNVPSDLKNVPLITFPTMDSPIVGWNPTINDEAQWSFLATQKYKYLDAAGNEQQVLQQPEANTAGMPSTNTVQGTSKPVVASDSEKFSQPRGQSIVATIDVDFFGDPLFSSYSMHSALFEINNVQVFQEGSLRITDDFFANFPGLNQILRKSLPVIDTQMPQDSPFNGYYVLHALKHRIDSSSGYTNSMQLYHLQDKV